MSRKPHCRREKITDHIQTHEQQMAFLAWFLRDPDEITSESDPASELAADELQENMDIFQRAFLKREAE